MSKSKKTGTGIVIKPLDEDPILRAPYKGVRYPLMSDYHVMLLLASPGDGKTTAIANLYDQYTGLFDRVFIFVSPVTKLPQSFLDKFPNPIILNTLHTLPKLLQDENEKEMFFGGAKCLIIIDDLQSEYKDPVIKKELVNLLAIQRHLGAGSSVWMTAQNYSTIPPEIRNAITSVCIFMSPLSNERVRNHIQEEFMADLTKKEMKNLYGYMVQKGDRHSFIFNSREHPTKYFDSLQRELPEIIYKQ